MGLYQRPLMLAHRCRFPGYPENTIISLKKILGYGIDYVEVDCAFTEDLHLVNIHGDYIDPESGKAYDIRDVKFSKLNELDLGFGQHVPELEDIFRIIAPTPVMIELDIKDPDILDYDEYPERNLLNLLIKYNLVERANINLSLFFPADYIREDGYYGKLNFRFTYNAYEFSENLLKELKRHGFFGVDFHDWALSPENVKMIHNYGLEVQSYPVNDAEIMRKLIRNDVDVIQTDKPMLLERVLKEEGYLIDKNKMGIKLRKDT